MPSITPASAAERALLAEMHGRCDRVLAAVPADAPTLCEGWAAHDLAIHLWLLNHDPLAWVGLGVPPLAGISARRAERVRARWSYADLLDRLRTGPDTFACMPMDRFGGYRHAIGEYFMHTQDVARANDVAQDPAGPELQDALWRRVQPAAQALHLRRTPGLVLTRTDRPERVSAQVTQGRPRLEVSGDPTELMCWVYGRTGVAEVALRPIPKVKRR